MMNNIIIVVPCYNDEAVLNETFSRLGRIARSIEEQHEHVKAGLLFVDDGSSDGTWDMIEGLSEAGGDTLASGIKLAHNSGHQNALWAGMEAAFDGSLPALGKADAIVSIDADLQDDVEAIPRMVDLYLQGYEVVYGVRKQRATDSFFKKTTAALFYKVMRSLGADTIDNHADFRLLGRQALESLMHYPERNLFLRGMVRSLGFSHAIVYYDRHERFAGESKYPLRKMISFALDGITSFSTRPLRYISYLGIFFIIISVLAIVYGLYAFAKGNAIPGWTSLLVSLWFIGGAILLAIGIIGEYVGKIYKEVKRRPRYWIERRSGEESKNDR